MRSLLEIILFVGTCNNKNAIAHFSRTGDSLKRFVVSTVGALLGGMGTTEGEGRNGSHGDAKKSFHT